MNLRRRISAPRVRSQHLTGLNESFNRGYRLRLIVRSAQPMSAPDPIASLWPCDGNFRFAPDSGHGRGIAITDAMCPKPTFAGIAAFGAKRTYVQTTRSEKRQKATQYEFSGVRSALWVAHKERRNDQCDLTCKLLIH
jgi:hypothetical protein